MNVAKAVPPSSMLCPNAEKVFGFIAGIGLPTQIVGGAAGFIEYVCVVDGGLHVDPRGSASALLHEAEHLTVMPASYRQYFNGDVGEGVQRMFRELD